MIPMVPHPHELEQTRKREQYTTSMAQILSRVSAERLHQDRLRHLLEEDSEEEAGSKARLAPKNCSTCSSAVACR